MSESEWVSNDVAEAVAGAFSVIAFAGILLSKTETDLRRPELDLMTGESLSSLFDHLADSEFGEEAEVKDLYTLLSLHQNDDPIGIISFCIAPSLEVRPVSWILAQPSWELVGYLMFPLVRRPKWLFWSPLELPTYGYRMYIPSA